MTDQQQIEAVASSLLHDASRPLNSDVQQLLRTGDHWLVAEVSPESATAERAWSELKRCQGVQYGHASGQAVQSGLALTLCSRAFTWCGRFYPIFFLCFSAFLLSLIQAPVPRDAGSVYFGAGPLADRGMVAARYVAEGHRDATLWAQ